MNDKPWEGKHFKNMLEILRFAYFKSKSKQSLWAYEGAVSMQKMLKKDWQEKHDCDPDSSFMPCFVCEKTANVLWNNTQVGTTTAYCRDCLEKIRPYNLRGDDGK